MLAKAMASEVEDLDSTIKDRILAIMAQQTRPYACAGVSLDIPGPFAENYAAAVHAREKLPWTTVDFDCGCIFAQQCSRMMKHPGATCAPCAALRTNPKLIKFVARAGDETIHLSTTNSPLLSSTQMNNRLNHHKAKSDKLNLSIFNNQKKLRRMLQVQDMHNEILQLVADNKIDRLKQVISGRLEAGGKVRSVLKAIAKAAEGTGSAKQFNQEDYDAALMVLRLGGHRLVRVMQKYIGLMSSRSIALSEFAKTERFLACAHGSNQHVRDMCTRNMKEFVFKRKPGARSGWNIQFDDVALDERGRWGSETNNALGFCKEHSSGFNMEITSSKDIEILAQAVEGGQLHLAKEATVFCLAPNRGTDYRPIPILAIGTCKKGETAAPFRDIIAMIMELWYEVFRDEGLVKRGPLTSACSDGFAAFALADAMLCDDTEVGPDSDLGEALGSLPLLDLHMGKFDLVGNRDKKHNEECQDFDEI
jgi:hypothetical protein